MNVKVEGFEYTDMCLYSKRIFRLKLSFLDRLKFLIYGYEVRFELGNELLYQNPKERSWTHVPFR